MHHLIIFIKNPQKGKVKTRIAQTAGEDRALQIYHELLRHTRNIALNVAARRWLFYSDFINENDQWSAQDFHKMVQYGADLGERMRNAFSLILSQPTDRTVIIGSDCTLLTADIIETAFAKLEEYPFVIGPATDGGYYLLGMQRFAPEVFRGIAWSTDTVLSATLCAIEALDEAYFLLPALPDIDFEEDWEKYGWEITDTTSNTGNP